MNNHNFKFAILIIKGIVNRTYSDTFLYTSTLKNIHFSGNTTSTAKASGFPELSCNSVRLLHWMLLRCLATVYTPYSSSHAISLHHFHPTASYHPP